MKKLLLLSSIFIAASSTQPGFAQQTGDFYIGFPSPDTLLTEDSVHLHFHVPASYQPGNPAKLIVGIHGLGNPQTPEQIRNYFSPAADSIYAVVVCPKPYITQPVSVNHPLSQIVINIAIDSMLQWYAIDTNKMYLAGYSAGSDVASRYTLENHKYGMKGLIWYAPGFFYQPNLSAHVTFPSTCLCFGTQDPLSNLLHQVDSIRYRFAQSPFDFFYNEIPGVEHTMEFPGFTKEMLECFRFFSDPENFVPDSMEWVGVPARTLNTPDFYPNPTRGSVFFRGGIQTENVTLKVSDLAGKIILEIPDFRGPHIDLSGQVPGVYLVNLQENHVNHYMRLILLEQ